MSKEHLNKGNPEHQFTSNNQPTPKAKSEGKRKKRLLKDLANALVSGERLNKCKAIAEKVGLDLIDDEFTLEIAMTLKQIEIALDNGDTRAFSAAMDRLIGKPEQSIKQTNIDATIQPLQFEIIKREDTTT
jgi:hypothetical protein